MSNLCNLSTQLDELKTAAIAAATVMGPENADLCATIAQDSELVTQLKDALTNDQLTGEQLAQLLTDRVLDPARQSAQQQQQLALDAIDKGFDTAKTNADRVTNSYALQPRGKRAQAKITFEASIAAVTDIVKKMATIDKRLDRASVRINALCYKQDSSDEEGETAAASQLMQASTGGNQDSAVANAAAAKALTIHSEAKLLDGYQIKRE